MISSIKTYPIELKFNTKEMDKTIGEKVLGILDFIK